MGEGPACGCLQATQQGAGSLALSVIERQHARHEGSAVVHVQVCHPYLPSLHPIVAPFLPQWSHLHTKFCMRHVFVLLLTSMLAHASLAWLL